MFEAIGVGLLVLVGFFFFFMRKSSASSTKTTPVPYSSFRSRKSSRSSKNRHSRRYTVRSGDSLGKIANKYGVKASDIAKLNNLDNPNDIRIGQILNIPTKEKASDSSASTATSKPKTDNKPTSIKPSKSGKTYKVRSGDSLGKIANKYKVKVSDIVQLNDLDNPNDIRVGQILNIPAGTTGTGNDGNIGKPFEPSKPPTNKPTPKSSGKTYIVKSGDSLGKIANKYKVKVSDIVKLNKLANPNDIYVGQVLNIPTNGKNTSTDGKPFQPSKPPTNKPTPKSSGKTYKVKSGDSLGKIANKYKVKVSDIVKLNKLANPNDIFVGQVLKIPANATDSGNGGTPIDPTPIPMPTPSNKTYIVKSGDSLGKIANKYKVKVSDIVKLNKLANPNDIFVGQVLKIPANTTDSGNGGTPVDPTPIPMPTPSNKTYIVKSGDSLGKIANKYKVKVSDIVKLNKLANPNDIFVGQVLKIPANTTDSGNGGTPVDPTPIPMPTPSNKTYIVKSGDSLGKIANKYKVKVSDIVKLNNLANPNDIFVGQVLKIPANATDSGNGGTPVDPTPIPMPTPSNKTYIVKSGDSLGKIANKYKVKVSDIVKLNNLANPNDIFVGQVLKIPANATDSGNGGTPVDPTPIPMPTPSNKTYIVKSGDSLGKIANKYKVKVSDIVKLNKLANPNDIFVGQVLKIPTDATDSGNGGTPVDPTPIPMPTPSSTTYIVKSGDSLGKIANKYKVKVSDIVKLNNLANPNDIYVGQVIILPAGATGNNNNSNGGNTHTPSNPSSGHSNNQSSNDRCTRKFHKVSRVILRHEGGYVNDPNDAGGKTNMGIAWRTWQKFAQIDLGVAPTTYNLKHLTEEQAEIIYRKRYWQPQGFCEVKNDRIGLMVYDWTITSGGAGKQIQRLLVNEFHQNIVVDGAIGPATIRALNNVTNQSLLLKRITEIRKDYYYMLVRNRPANRKFIKGWINRVNDCLEVPL